MVEGKFGTAINCMDGRVQEPVIRWMKDKYDLDYVDMITEPGPVKLISEWDPGAVITIKHRVRISVDVHGSGIIAVVGHHDCTGNPKPKEEQVQQINKSIERINSWNTGAEVIGLYVNENREVETI